MRDKDFVIIMAGGIGSRFWPMSRSTFPKQFHDILGMGKTMIRMTYDRFSDFIPQENIFIVTNERYGDIVRDQLPGIRDSEILLEPVGRNTAPCIAYAAFKIRQRAADACILVVGADYLILDENNFLKDAALGLDESRDTDKILTLGIRPTRPDTGYGYIQFIEEDDDSAKIFRVKTFTEKPPLEVAKDYLRSGEFLWNSGMFIFSMETILKAFQNFLPDMYDIFDGISQQMDTPQEKNAIGSAYSRCRNISIDYGIMEQAENVFVIPSSFDWSDLGTWGSVYEHVDQDYVGNAVQGDVKAFDSANNMIRINDPKKLVVLQGLNDFIVVDTGDTLLICRKEDEQEIKTIVNEVRKSHGDDKV